MDGGLAHADADRRRLPAARPRAKLNVFQIMEVRSILGFFMLYPLVHMNGGLAAMEDVRGPAAAYRAQPHSLCGAARLVLRG